VADAGKAFGQDVEQPATDELVWMERHDIGLAGVAGGPAQQDVALFVVTDESFGGKGAALDIAGEVAQGGAAAADVLEFDVPVF